jgi:hypothetical protein
VVAPSASGRSEKNKTERSTDRRVREEPTVSIPILIQTYNEVRRLAIAGSAVAPGDFRLKKLVPQLEQVGQKAPLFAKIGEAVSRLVASDEKTSARALLELTALLSAVLYTQGETGIDGELVPIKIVELGLHKTQTSARVLKPLQEALTTTGSGRLEIIRDAHDGGAFHDLRLIAPALAALDDAYPEIGDFVAQQILPLYGQAIFPHLQAAFDPKGRAGHVRRLLLMHRLDREGTRAHVQRSLDDGSKEVRIAAIGCLGDSPDDLAFLLEQVKAKAKDVRAAALRALGSSRSDAAAKVLCQAIAGANLELAIEPVRASRHALVTETLLEAAENQFEALVAGKESDSKTLGTQIERVCLILDCLRGRDDKQTEGLLLSLFEHAGQLGAIKGEPSGREVAERLASVMAAGPPSLRSKLVDAHVMSPAECLGHAFVAACRSRKPADVFTLFSPYLAAKVDEKKKGRDPLYAKREAIIQLLLGVPTVWYREHIPDDFALNAHLDPRWLDLAIELGRSDLVQSLAVPGHANANAYLAELFQHRLGKPGADHELVGILNSMIRIGHPQATDATIEVIKRSAKAKSAFGYYWIGHLIPRLPKAEALPKLEALLPTLPEKMIDQFLGLIAALK